MASRFRDRLRRPPHRACGGDRRRRTNIAHEAARADTRRRPRALRHRAAERVPRGHARAGFGAGWGRRAPRPRRRRRGGVLEHGVAAEPDPAPAVEELLRPQGRLLQRRQPRDPDVAMRIPAREPRPRPHDLFVGVPRGTAPSTRAGPQRAVEQRVRRPERARGLGARGDRLRRRRCHRQRGPVVDHRPRVQRSAVRRGGLGGAARQGAPDRPRDHRRREQQH